MVAPPSTVEQRDHNVNVIPMVLVQQYATKSVYRKSSKLIFYLCLSNVDRDLCLSNGSHRQSEGSHRGILLKG